ncbi:MAG: sulfatase/phosphatase domain-containing protein, partial [Bacteroidota bacterium]
NIRQQLFTRILQQNNYQTAWIGKWHLQTLPGDAFNYWMVPPDQGNYYNPDFINMQNDTVRIDGYITEIISDLAFDWLSNKRDKDKPFCLVVGEKATHREWLPDIQDLGAYDNKTFKLPANFYDKYQGRKAAANQDMTIDKTMRLKEDLKVHLDYNNGPYDRFNPVQKKAFVEYYDNKVTTDFDAHHYTGDSLLQWKYQRYLKDYLSVARSLDRNIGKILDYLDQNGLTENTVVIYASDQGFYMGEHGWFDKRFMYEESFRTPFVMRYPGMIKPGTSVDNMIANIDFAPTLLDIAGVKAPADIQGNSFLPVLKSKQNVFWRDGIYYHYYEYPEPHKVSPHFGIRTKQYKLIRFYGPADFWELYDLKKDPNEMQNLYNRKEYATIIVGLKKKLDSLIAKYADTEAAEILKKKR